MSLMTNKEVVKPKLERNGTSTVLVKLRDMRMVKIHARIKSTCRKRGRKFVIMISECTSMNNGKIHYLAIGLMSDTLLTILL